MMIGKEMLVMVTFLCLLFSSVKAADHGDDIPTAINKFTFDFLSATEEENNFFSPYSISFALAMTYAGARGNTEKEMAEVLYFPPNKENFHQSVHRLNVDLEKRTKGNITLKVANALWADKETNLLDDYLRVTGQYYDAGVNRVDFINEAEKSRQTINRWVEKQTEDKIKNLLEPGTVDRLTRLVLTNAIYFLADWTLPFEKEATVERSFYSKPGQELKTLFMQNTGSYLYFSNEELQAVQMPYQGNETAMIIILPAKNSSLSGLMAKLDYDYYKKIGESLKRQETELIIPKFKFESKYNLRELFISLGMKEPFTGKADFSSMVNKEEEFFIDNIIHQAYVAVDEKGTEAAAATAVVMRTTAFEEKPEPIVFLADRPFLFFIRDIKTGAILFSGRLHNPQTE